MGAPSQLEIKDLLVDHLLEHYELYGPETGLYTARKHIGWYVQSMAGGESFRQRMNQLQSCEQQLQAVKDYFDGDFLNQQHTNEAN